MITPDKQYIITKYAPTTEDQVDKSTWTYAPGAKEYTTNHGPRMILRTKTGQMNLLMALDSRINHGTIRTGSAMIRFITTLASQVGMEDPEGVAKRYARFWLNEGLIKEVA